MPRRILILETSGRVGYVALSSGEALIGVRRLEEAQRHARDLAPATRDLLAAAGHCARALDAIIVSRGPGSYTGLRVGIISAKTLAFATGAAVVAVDTFAGIAQQAPPEAQLLDVIADAQQDRVYVQRFRRDGAGFEPATLLSIRPFAEWAAKRSADVWLAGPGIRGKEDRLPPHQILDPALWDPRPESLLALGRARLLRGERDDPWTLEPLYLRPSAAEEQWKGR